MEVMTTASAHDQSETLSLAVHEFRTPVTVVAGYLRMLAQEQLGPLSDRQRKVVEEAQRSCARLTGLLQEMSDLANLIGHDAPAARDDVEIGALLDDVAGRIEEGRDRQIAVVRRGPNAPLVVRADRKRLTSALTAIVTAVVREQSEAGRVAVDAAAEQLDGQRVAALTVGREDAAEQSNTGGPDARFNEFRGGLGLSLPIARRVIEQAGGRIWSSSDGRRLGTIAVRLPLKESLT